MSSSKRRKTIPVRGLGQKNVVFGRHPDVGERRGPDLFDGDRPQQHRRVGAALGDDRRHRPGVVAVGDVTHQPGTDRGVEAGRIDADQLGRLRAAHPVERGGGEAQEGETVTVDQPQALAGAHGGLERVDPGLGVRPERVDVDLRAEAGPQVGRSVDEPVDGAHVEHRIVERHDERHDRRRCPVVGVLGAVGGGGLEPVVPVGEDQGGAGDPGADGVDAGGVEDRDQLVDGAVPVARGRRRRVGHGDGRGEVLGEREAPDRVEVRARGAEQLESVPAGLREGLLVGEHVLAVAGGETQRADHAYRLPRRPRLVVEPHPVHVERRGGVAGENALLEPASQRRGGLLVRVGGRRGLRQNEAHRVVGVSGLELCPLLLVDDVVRWGHHRRGVRRVAVPGPRKGKEVGHGWVRFR